MREFLIPEANMERLEKKLNRIKNKCSKYGLSYTFSITGEEYQQKKDGSAEKFYHITVDGVAILNGWRFVAVIEHKEGGNIIRQFDTAVEVPAKYRTVPPICEHCNSRRARRDTYIIQNESGDFKQVGKTCLLDYTKGLSAENVAAFMEGFDLEDYTIPPVGYGKPYFSVLEYLSKTVEITRIFGFRPTSAREDSTASMVWACQRIWDIGPNPKSETECKIAERLRSEKYNPDGEEAITAAQNIIEWAKGFSGNSSDYLYNLSVLCSSRFVERRDLGILASAPNTYNRDIERQAKRKKAAESRAASQYVGEVGEKLEIDVDSFTVLTSFSTQWGVTIIYKFNSNGNTIIWKTSNLLPEKVTHISGKVKEHSEYNGEKQTVLTRCKVR